LAKETGLSRRGIEKNINLFKTKGLLDRVEPDKSGYWKVIEKDEKQCSLKFCKRVVSSNQRGYIQ
jgi:predicted HTH transcriptional regulator